MYIRRDESGQIGLQNNENAGWLIAASKLEPVLVDA
jgi:hypothetical protein